MMFDNNASHSTATDVLPDGNIVILFCTLLFFKLICMCDDCLYRTPNTKENTTVNIKSFKTSGTFFMNLLWISRKDFLVSIFSTAML